MERDKTSLERTILLATSVVGGLGGLFAAINGLSDSVRKTVGIFAGFNEWQLGVAALVLVAVSWWLFRLSRRRRSVLLHPEALRLERANPAHLFGRREDIDQLVRLCREEPLVFLEGESGAGKSALLQAGLVPALKGHPGLLPIYVESLAGSDWERDPRVFLATALWSALDETSPTASKFPHGQCRGSAPSRSSASKHRSAPRGPSLDRAPPLSPMARVRMTRTQFSLTAMSQMNFRGR